MSDLNTNNGGETPEKTPLWQRPWARLWVMSEVLAILAFIGFFAWPRESDNLPPSGAASPVTRDTSVRTADNVPMGTVEEFATNMTNVQTIDARIRVDLRYRGTDNFTGAPLPGYEGNVAYLRREAAIALALVEQDLAHDSLGLLVYDSYRPVRATNAMVAWTVREHREQLVTDGYISDRSRHNLGVAIDCTIVDAKTGQPLDMGTPFDTFSEAAHTANATGAAATNRANFVAVMKKRGFTNYEQEWWHFTYAVPDSTLRRFDIPIR